MLLAVLGTMEIVIIVAVILLIFGPSKLPQLGEGIGKMLRGFKKEMKAIEDDKAKTASKAVEGPEADEAVAEPADRDEIDVTPKGESKPKPKAAEHA